MKLIMQTQPISQKCKLCDKLDTKTRRRIREQDKVNRWKKDAPQHWASIEKAYEEIKKLDKEIHELRNERQRKLQAI